MIAGVHAVTTGQDHDWSVLDAALAAHDAGLCVIRGKADGSKAPLGSWKRYQTERPTREQVHAWFAHGHPALMVVAGAVSGNLEMLELEARAIDEGLGELIDRRAAELGLFELLERIIAGYCERTGSGGLHLFYRCDTIAGNTKLATRPATAEELAAKPGEPIKVLIETRGEGGAVMVAPSHGPTHDSGEPYVLESGGFDTIATISPDERAALWALMAEFHVATPLVNDAVKAPPREKQEHTRWNGGAVGESWFDTVVHHIESEMTMRERLEDYGWSWVATEPLGDLMRRPSKDGATHSARINSSGRLINWSSSVPLEVPTPGHTPSHDQLDVIAAYEYAGDRHEAARDIAQRTGIMAAWRHEQDDATRQDLGIGRRREDDQRRPPANVDPETGEVIAPEQAATEPPRDINLPDEFWKDRPELEHVRQAAHSRGVSADAVLGAVLARIAAMMPPSEPLPAIVGRRVPLNLLVGLIGSSGAGKGSAKAIAKELLPSTDVGVRDDLPLGSGEGIAEAFYSTVEDPAGKNKPKRARSYRGAFFYLDEGQALGQMAERSGATLLPTLRSVFTGDTVGQMNARADTTRKLDAGTYSVGFVMGLQPELCGPLLDDAAGGTPQRFVFVSATDPTIPDDAPDWPGVLRWTVPKQAPMEGGTGFDVAPAIAQGIRQRSVAKNRGETVADEFGAHADLVRLKVAGALAALAGRYTIEDDDWRLAGSIQAVSSRVAGVMQTTVRLQNNERHRAADERHILRTIRTDDAQRRHDLRRLAGSVGRHVDRHHRNDTGCTAGCAKRALAGRDRALLSIDEVLEYSVELGYTRQAGDRWLPVSKAGDQ